jgi:hypothetical protein
VEFHALHSETTLASQRSSFASAPHVGSNLSERIPIEPRDLEKVMSNTDSVAAIYRTQAEQTNNELQEASVDIKNLSVAGKDTHSEEHVVGFSEGDFSLLPVGP